MTEYVACMIAAGWITAGDVDDEYQAYLNTPPRYDDDDDCSYEGWQGMRREWQALNTEYESLNASHPDMWDTWNHPQRMEGERLIKAMSDIEFHLRH
jgi:hypothetical protein